ncbi:PDZ domain-containing protein [Mangrovibrevibacter kandeliae]|uniref:PDZ domain-containing protein n=1 Tax=Mangrovibrevibacter kandeliae TaxID=2968473 RepID=UPI002117DD0B|nr:PDZ domain-containing protein [Aurantimonas sp. CSK15Z-1]MCQ8783024.1 PDZ domain-containing protein [Aurantimonas sp. CSK15Z-1]
MKTIYRALRMLVATSHILTAYAVVPPTAALAAGAKLPAPSVSKALDAVLMPIDRSVVKAFGLEPRQRGLLVIAVQPGGIAAQQGIKPGDVLTEIGGRRVNKPVELDLAVARGLKRGTTSYGFSVARGGAIVPVAAVITLALFEESIAVGSIASWESYSSSSFSYSEFVSEYSEEIETSYESEETEIEQVEATSEETSTEDATTEETTDDSAATEDEDAPDGDGDGDAGSGDDDDMSDGDGADDGDGDGGMDDDGGDAGDDDGGDDDGGGDDGGGDDDE